MKHLFTILLFCGLPLFAFAQPCGLDQSVFTISLVTDNYGYETSWEILNSDGDVLFASTSVYGSNLIIEESYCLPAGECVIFRLKDSYGDGMSWGSCTFTFEGETYYQAGNEFYTDAYLGANCGTGQTCFDPLTIGEGNHSTANGEWFYFVTPASGSYELSTCGTSTCNTTIWVYEGCNYNSINSTNAGTFAFSEDGCGEQALLPLGLVAGNAYYIKVGNADGTCTDSINFSLTYNGAFTGCTDVTACNYNPAATVDDSSCIAWGSLDCPEAPDLVVLQEVLQSSIYANTLNNNDECLINEGCLHGYGERELVNFSTHIKNIGDADYFIGVPSAENSQFTFDNCHGHWHYEGYAEYLLYNNMGINTPASFKNGFCVLDLECDDGGDYTYTCGNMGISAQCGDIYSSGLPCQWVDVTDLPDGDYTMVVRVNWDNSPDQFGRVEQDTINNWAQVCFNIDRTSGTMAVVVNTDCPIIQGCDGVLYSDAVLDCNGVCSGTSLRGDIDANEARNVADAQMYMTEALPLGIDATTCNDLNADGALSVYDAALLNACLVRGENYYVPNLGVHNYCDYPAGIENPFDTVWYAIDTFGTDVDGDYVDIAITHPHKDHVGFQFALSGLPVEGAELLTGDAFPAQITHDDSVVVILSMQDSAFSKSTYTELESLVRIRTTFPTSFMAYLEPIETVNSSYERSVSLLTSDTSKQTIVVVVNENADLPYFNYSLRATPNPFTKSVQVEFNNPLRSSLNAQLSDVMGRTIQNFENLKGESLTIERGNLPAGVYFLQLMGPNGQSVVKLVAL